MKIHNVRMGFATNSSSTHSIIMLPGGASDSDLDAGFGWNYFTAGSKQSKALYLACLLRDNMMSFTTEDIAILVTKEWLEVDPEDEMVDHQSRIALPSNWRGNAVHRQFLNDFTDFMMRDDVVILGGNDNNGYDHHLQGDNPVVDLPLECTSSVAKWDETYKFWTLFNRGNGTKIRMSFESMGEELVVTRSESPELVDMKITDYCPFGCDFCYQDSTTEGEHAKSYKINNMLYGLSSAKVFEVAFGGGETTMHPDFVDILRTARSCNIVPNFTTKSLVWMKDDSLRPKIIELCGSFAYSANSMAETKKFLEIVEKKEIPNHKANIQVVMGVVPEDELAGIMDLCGEHRMRLTLLGYKTNGRGNDVTPLRYRDWLKLAAATKEKHGWSFRVGVDTLLAKQFENQLEAAGVSDKFYTVEEGKFSMYIDMVKQQAGPSSFCKGDEMVEFKHSNRNYIMETFQGFTKEKNNAL